MKINTLRDLYLEELRDIYDAENQLVKALPTMAKSANNEELRNSIEEHLEITKEHVNRLERIFEDAKTSPKGKKCRGIQGIIEECKEFLDEDTSPEVMDAGLIGCAQRAEHYEI